MIELIEQALASMYDAVVRGICWALTLGIAANLGIMFAKHIASIIKAVR